MTDRWPTGKDAIKKHNELVRQAMLNDGYTEEEIDRMLKEEDENPDPGMVKLFAKIKTLLTSS